MDTQLQADDLDTSFYATEESEDEQERFENGADE